jgi:hypothetical protein
LETFYVGHDDFVRCGNCGTVLVHGTPIVGKVVVYCIPCIPSIPTCARCEWALEDCTCLTKDEQDL